MSIHVVFVLASVIALIVICGQNVVIATSLSNDNNIQSIRIKRRTARQLESGGGTASSYSVDTSAISGPFYVIRQDVEGNLYAQISETYDMNKYETVSCKKVGHHPVIITCPYGKSFLEVNAIIEPAKKEITYHDAHGKFKLVEVDKQAEVKPNFLRSSQPSEEMKQVKQGEIVNENQADTKEDNWASMDASLSTEESSSSDDIINPPAIAAISVISVLFMLFFAYCTCCCLVDDDDDDDSDAEEDELDDENENGKFHDDHTSVTRGLGGSVASLYDVDLSTNESINGDDIDDLDIDNDDHIYEENVNKSPPKLMES